MQWIDYRLGFQNLKKSYLENEIPDGVSRKLWKPDLVFVNALHRQNVQKEADLSYRIMLMMDKNGSSTEAPLGQFDEAKVYNSRKPKFGCKPSIFCISSVTLTYCIFHLTHRFVLLK